MKYSPIIVCSIFLVVTKFSYANPESHNQKKLPSPLFDTSLMYSMLSNSTSFSNELNILQAKQTLSSSKMYIGGYAQGGFSNVNASYPTFFYSNNLTYKVRNYFSLDRIAFASIANVNPWLAMYLEVGSADMGEAYVSNATINQGYFLFGNNELPLYGFVGYKNIDFGNFSTVNIFAQPITRWDYAGTAPTVGIGYRFNDVNITLSALQGGSRGREDYYGAGLWRVHNYTNYYTAQGNNFAVNTNYKFHLADVSWNLGVGYMRGLWLGNPTNFFNNSTIGAWDVNTQIYFKKITLLAEYVQSLPRTTSFGNFRPSNPVGVALRTWDVGMSYKYTNFLLPRESTISADYSGVWGNTAFANATQFVLGFNNEFIDHIKAGLEYVIESQSSNQGANRSGLFYRAHNRVQIMRFDLTANF